MKDERRIGGLWCGEVLERLADYVDDELDAAARRHVEAHLGGCDICERFGGEYAATVRQIRLRLAAAEPMEESRRRALRQRVLAALDE